MEKQCRQCQKWFSTNRTDQIFCSPECHKAYKVGKPADFVARREFTKAEVDAGIFTYPSQNAAKVCERAASEIRLLMGKSIATLAQIGENLKLVKDTIGHPLLYERWLDYYFGWSLEHARVYREVYRAVEEYPTVLQFRSITLAKRFPGLPERTQREILEQNAFRYTDAQEIIQTHKREDWEQGVLATFSEIDLLDEDEEMLKINEALGDAKHEIEQAMDDPTLRPAAVELMKQHAMDFALLSDSEPADVLSDAGVTLQERLPPTPIGMPPPAYIREGIDNTTIEIWTGQDEISEPQTLITFHHIPGNAEAESWRAAAILACKKLLNAREQERKV